MKLVDVQVLFYAVDSTSAHHGPAAGWLEAAINGPESVGLAWPTLLQFLGLGTRTDFPGAMSWEEALGWVGDWFRAAGVELVDVADIPWPLFEELVAASPRDLRNAVDDAQLAALSISRGATLASFDGDFEPFVAHGLRWERLGSAQG